LADLVELYAALPNRGEVAALRYRDVDPTASGRQIFGPAAAWYVNGILAAAPPAPGVVPAEMRRGRRLAFKTGTSYGFRDFWAVGYDPDVTIGVWAGRPDGTPIPGGSGRLTAAPVLFKIADLLGPAPPRSDAPPPGVLLVARNDLPLRLQRLDPRSVEQNTLPAGGLRIAYPPDDAQLEWRGEEVRLEVSGGKAPYRWLVDGRPLPAEQPRRPVYWQPDGVGFAKLAVIDAEGRSARSTVRLSP
jgi:penicillin-binding protein 1C